MTGESAGSSAFRRINATRLTATIMGVIFGFSGMTHGLFEVLQGNQRTPGPFIQAIGEGQRFWPLGTEDAFTLVPNFAVTGALAMLTGLAIILWSIWGLPRPGGRGVFLGLFIVLFLVGGGIAQVVFFIPTWAFATRMDKPLAWWAKVLPPRVRPFLSWLWPVTLAVATISLLIGLEIAIFGYVPGLQDPERILSTALLLVLAAAILNVVTFIAGFGHELLRRGRD